MQQLDWLDLVGHAKRKNKVAERFGDGDVLSPFRQRLFQMYKPVTSLRAGRSRDRSRMRTRTCPRIFFREARQRYYALRRKLLESASCQSMDVDAPARRLVRSNSAPSLDDVVKGIASAKASDGTLPTMRRGSSTTGVLSSVTSLGISPPLPRRGSHVLSMCL
eukprot:m.254700 g.254700  ORF g.254700 m.254700 type:complete len:163 (+) comp19059_c0_seq1:57-545(+)